MELLFILLWALMALLGYLLWVFLKNLGTFHHIFDQLPQWIRFGPGVVGLKELKDIREKLFGLKQQIYVREGAVTTADTLPAQFQECFEEVGIPVDRPESLDESLSVIDGSASRPRSIMWNGLRFSLSDSIWLRMGVVPKEDVEDGQVQVMVQGPFCRVCLRRLVERSGVRIAVVPAHCHNCGLSWSKHEFDCPAILLNDLKRMVYDMLDRKVRTNQNVQR